MEKISTNQPSLRGVQGRVRFQCFFHFRSTRLEDVEKISVAAFEILQHITQLPSRAFGIKPEDPIDDMIGPGLIRRVEVPGLGRRFEGSDDDPGGIWPQVQDLAVQESGLRQSCPLGSSAVRPRDLRDCAPIGMRIAFGLSLRRA